MCYNQISANIDNYNYLINHYKFYTLRKKILTIDIQLKDTGFPETNEIKNNILQKQTIWKYDPFWWNFFIHLGLIPFLILM